ncbi:DUF86 domain-containing protein [Microbacterium sp. NPDC059771]|uniref:HepT-like ribonuclease domain-containing protein n=1 Tax=Microbacterium sp. NPDC059771 TaxID=3346941 RepID=UPI003646A4AF
MRIERTPLSAWEPLEQAKILQCLGNLTEIFGYIDVLAAAGEERFYAADDIVLGAVVGRLIQLGEQAGGLPGDFRDLQKSVPDYTAMVAMRNKLAHEYEEVDSPLVWSTVARCRTHHAKKHEAVRRHYDVRYDAQQRWISAFEGEGRQQPS